MKRQIVFWHGRTDSLFDDLIKLVGCKTEKDKDGGFDTVYFEGSLDDFVAGWKRPVIVTEAYIAVTQFSSFGQR
jgi:hypothetical protein